MDDVSRNCQRKGQFGRNIVGRGNDGPNGGHSSGLNSNGGGRCSRRRILYNCLSSCILDLLGWEIEARENLRNDRQGAIKLTLISEMQLTVYIKYSRLRIGSFEIFVCLLLIAHATSVSATSMATVIISCISPSLEAVYPDFEGRPKR
jgi:hypothetical protein